MSGSRRSPQARDRMLGAQLRTIRKERTTLSLEAAADAAGWSPATLSRTENGKRHVTSEDMAVLLTLYRVPPVQRDQLVLSAKEARQAAWWSRPMPGVLEDIGTTLATYETEAHTLTDWSITVIPGLLQTEKYAKGVMLLDGATPQEAEVRWLVRRKRQGVLRHVDHVAYIHEYGLRTSVGGAAVMKEQLEHLLSAPERGQRVRIVPERAARCALLHSWLLMEFPDEPPVVYVELERSGVFLHNEAVAIYAEIRAKLEGAALSTAETRGLLTSLIERM